MSGSKINPDHWFIEVHEEAKVLAGFEIEGKALYSKPSDFQKVEIYQTKNHGKLLAHDDKIMVTEKDEFVYHDMIVHVPMFTHPKPKHVLVIGGGDGGTVREVLRHPSVETCTMVEIDGDVVEACKEWIPKTSSELTNPKVSLKIQDGVEFVKNSQQKFDVILVDSSDPIGPATPLFNVDFYKDINKILSDDGIVVSQAESPFYEMNMQKALVKIKAQVFDKLHLYNYINMSYPGCLWSFSFASRGLCPFKDFDPGRVTGEFQYYNPQIHWGAFMLPEFQKKAHGDALTPTPTPFWK